MKLMNRIAQILAVTTAVIASAPAAAAVFDFTYEANGIDASGRFITTDTPNANGFFEIISLSGLRNGMAMSLLQPGSFPGDFPNDNLLKDTPSFVNSRGFSFTTDKAYNVYLYNSGAGVYAECHDACIGANNVNQLTTFTVTPTPTVVYDFSYTADGISASGTLTATATANSNGFFEIISLSGLRNGMAMSLLQPGSFPGDFANDNLLKDTPSFVNSRGFSFTTDQAYNVYLYNSGAGIYAECHDDCIGSNNVNLLTDFSVVKQGVISPVPESSTWALLIVGFAGIGWRLRHRSTVASRALQPHYSNPPRAVGRVDFKTA